MTEPRQHDDGGTGTAPSSPQTRSGQQALDATTPGTSTGAASAATSEAVAGPFTLRETVIGVSVLVMFVGTILPFAEGVNLWRAFSLFFLGIGILLPIAAVALLVGRRLGAKNLRVGSLAVDQFASVTAALAVSFFFLQTVTTFGIGQFIALLGSVGFLVATVGGPHLGIFKPDFAGRPSSSAHPIAREALPAKPRPPKPVPAEQVKSWQGPGSSVSTSGASSAPNAGHGAAGPNGVGPSAGFAVVDYAAGQQAGTQQPMTGRDGDTPRTVAGSTAVQHSPGADHEQAPSPASTSAPQNDEDSAPRASEAVAEADPAPTTAQPTVQETTEDQNRVQDQKESAQAHPRTDSISATRDAEEDEPVVEAFWFAVGTPRSVVDEQTGAPLFVLQPGDWEVGIEDRGHEFLVQDKRTGRIGVMRDLRNIERAPQE